ncbi:MAG: hypothetical protein ACR2KV_02135 [Solirubrobacteraceae bacterium]
MSRFRRRSLGRAAKKSARRTGPRRFILKLVYRIARPFAPGMIAGAASSYFLDKTAGAERRKKALALTGGLRKK